ncbi:outer membrane beta-barrel protein [Dysgonomonas sp. ZJ709]|uniref:outer membrane beta-barrel protein n=1 Tax=Dysgonomonas sp. ZJ709 TaxID=2709797 RepID=UPI0013EBB6C9|nr:outer membrane beta-barrel protein [Dysgonomonas sp. ZJ709]
MKKIILGLFLVCLAFNLSAQNRRHELRGGYGVGTSNEAINSLSDILITDATKNVVGGDKTFNGAFNLGYKYSLNEKINVGANFSYERAGATAFVDVMKSGELKSHYYTIAAEADYIYFRRENFTFYSTVGLGGTIYDQKYKMNDGGEDTKSHTNLNFQLSPIGVKYGDRLGFFGEMGFGYKGLFNFGLFTRF